MLYLFIDKDKTPLDMENVSDNQVEQLRVSYCAICHEELYNFMGYVPDVGEVCYSCYIDYQKKIEKNV